MKPYVVIDAEQRTADWFAARAGRVTASKASELFATRKDGKEAAGRRDYRMQLALERILGKPLDDGSGYQNADMRRGVELEPDALALYEAVRGVVVAKTGFLAHTAMPIGVSPDGVIEDGVGLLELKSPRPANHFGYIQAGVVPTEYVPQIVHGQLVTGAAWTDFASYCPDMPLGLELFVVRVERDERQIASYQLSLTQFLAEVDTQVDAVRAVMAKAKAA